MTEQNLSFGLSGEDGNLIGSAELRYHREHFEYTTPIPFSDEVIPAHTDRAIVGDLTIKDKDNEALGTLRFRTDGIFYEYVSKADGKIHTMPIDRLSTDSTIIFTAEDDMFKSHFIPMLAFTIAMRHHQPEVLRVASYN